MENGQGTARGGRDTARVEVAEMQRRIREALAVRAAWLGLEAGSITSPAPGAVVACTGDGGVLRLDLRMYQLGELDR